MVCIPSQPDLRQPLARALVCRLAELDVPPSTTVAVCTWLARLPEAIERIDGGEYIVVVSAVGFLPQLFDTDGARAATAEHPADEFLAVDLRPALAAIRAAAAERN